MRANNYPTTNLNFTVHDLREGGKYEFRVIAINEAGPGKPSKPTDIVQCKEQKSKYLYKNLGECYKKLSVT